MTDPAMLAIATAVAAGMAGGSAQSLTEAARQAMGSLVTRIRQRLARHPDDEAILDAIEDDHDPATRDEAVQALAEALAQAGAEDPRFREELLRLGRQAGVPLSTEPQSSMTLNAGSIGTVVSAARDMHIGNLSL